MEAKKKKNIKQDDDTEKSGLHVCKNAETYAIKKKKKSPLNVHAE